MKAFLKTTKGKIILGGAALLIILLLVLLITKVIGGEEGYRIISVSEISGSVMTENDGKKYEAYKNMRLADGYALTTDIASYTRMVLDNDKYVKLEEKSRALFESLGSDKQRKTAIRLEDGVLTTEITAPLGDDEDYIVNTPNAVLAVRGTFFKAVVRYDTNGDAYTDVYTYGGTVMCKRVMPDGTVVEEEVMITSGYKARVKMDEIITVYVEELIEEDEDNVDPIDIKEVPDGDIVDIYNASVHGHKMFKDTSVLWQEIIEREIDLNDYHSVYDGDEIPAYGEDNDTEETDEQTETTAEIRSETETERNEASADDTDIFEEDTDNYENTESTDGYYSAEGYGAEETVVSTAETSTAGNYGTETSAENRGHSVTTASTDKHDYTESTQTEAIEETSAVTEVTSLTSDETTSAEYSVNSGTTISETNSVPEVTKAPDSTSNTGSGTTTTVPSETVHVHSFGEYISDGNATCTEDGTKTAVCSCGEKDTVIDTGSAGHKEVREVTEATVVSEGHIHIYCSVCGETIADEVIPKLPIYIDDGNLVISETGYSQGGKEEIPYTGDYNISQRSSSPAASSITVISGTHNINFNGIETNTASDTFTVEKGAAVTITGGSRENKLSASGDNCCGLYSSGGSAVIKSGIFRFSGSYGIFGTADSVISIDGGYIFADGQSDGIRNSGAFTVSGGNISAYGGDNGIWNNGEFTAVGGSLSAEGGSKDIRTWTNATVTGGSVHAVKDKIDGTFVNSIGDELECEAFDVFPSETVRTFENSEGDKYIYGLASEDKASDGYYYVWKPIDFIPEFDGTVYTDDGTVTITDTGFVQGEKTIPWTGDWTISQKDRGTAFDAEIIIESGVHSITFDGININSTNGNGVDISSGADITVNGSFKENIIASAQGRGINNGGALSIDSGAFSVSGGYCGLYSASQTAVNGGRISVSGGVCDIFSAESGTFTVSGGSMKPDTPAIDGTIINRSGDELECKVYSEYTGDLTFEDGDGNEYTYALDVSDNIDGGYYVWQPKEIFYGSIDLSKGAVTITEDGFVQNGVTTPWTGDYTITQGDGSSAITIESGTHNIILEDANISADGYGLTIAEDAEVTLVGNGTFTGISVSGTLNADNCEITSEGQYGIYISGSGKVSIDSGSFELYGENSGIFCSGKLEISGGSVNADGGQYGILNSSNGVISVSGGKTSISGGADDIYSSGEFAVTGGSVRSENDTLIGSIVNTDGTELECAVFDTFPSEAERTFKNPDGSEYVYKLTEGDRADDGKYYVWKPKAAPAPTGVEVSEENFPDEVFRNYVSTNFDKDSDGYLSDSEIAAATEVNVSGTESDDGGIVSLQGIEYFDNLKTLSCYYNSGLTSLDVSKNTALNILYCDNTQIKSLDVSNNTALKQLECYNTQITSLNVSNNTALKILYCDNTQITSLDVSKNTVLRYFGCYNTKITSLDVSNNTALTRLECGDTPITSLDVSNNTALTRLECGGTPITSLNVSNNTALKILYCDNTQITSLDVSNNTALNELRCSNTKIPYVDITNNMAVITFEADGCEHYVTVVNGKFDTKTIDGFDYTRVSDIVGAVMDENGVLSVITEGTNITYTYDCGQGKSETFTLVPDENSTFDTEEVPFDGTLDLNAGPVTITAEGFVQNDITTPWTGDYIITQEYGSSAITIESGKHNIILENASISADGYGLTIAEGAEVTLDGSGTFSGISVSGTLNADNCDIVSEGQYGIYISGSGTVSIASGSFVLSGENSGIFCGGKLEISGGSVSAEGGQYGVMNTSSGVISVSGGTTSISGGTDDIYSSGELLATGGSVRAENGTVIGSILNPDGAELECVVFDTFPSETERTFTSPGGSEYVYKLTEGDRAADGKYYVWKPKAVPTGVEISAENFPDTVFRNYVSANFDKDSDGYLSDEEIAEATEVNVSGTSSADGGVASLKGIEYLTALENLYFGFNTNIVEFDVSKNTALKLLLCSYTSTTDIDISNNINLEIFGCNNTKVTSIDLSNNVALQDFICHETSITSLDLSNNMALTYLDCDNTQITSLDVSKNTALTYLDCSFTQITSLDVSKNTALESLYCGETQITSLDVSNNTALKYLYCYNTQITSLDVSNNTALIRLYCNNTQLTSLDVSNNADLCNLDCQNTKISHVDITNTSVAIFMTGGCEHPITVVNGVFDTNTIDGFDYTKAVGCDIMDENGVISGITEGMKITYTYDCGRGKSATFTLVPDENSTFFKGVEVNEENFPDTVFRNYVSAKFDKDSDGYLSDSEISTARSVNLSSTVYWETASLKGIEYLSALRTLDCSYTKVSNIDISNNTKLLTLLCEGTEITALDVSGCTALGDLYCSETPMTSLNASGCKALKNLYCDKSSITSLDISNCISLKELTFYNSQIPYIDITSTAVTCSISTNGSKFPITVVNGVFDTKTIDGFDYTKISDLQYAVLDENGVMSEIFRGAEINYTYQCGSGYFGTFTLVPDENSTFATGVEVNEENFPDTVFRNYVSTNFDKDSDGYLSDSEISEVTSIDVSYKEIYSLQGIEHFTTLSELDCVQTQITSLDVSKNTALESLYCGETQITSLDLSNNVALKELDCSFTEITSLNVSNNTALTRLDCNNTQITGLDVSKNTALEILYCSNVQLTSLDVSNNTALTWLFCGENQITSLDVRNNIALTELGCNDTQITRLDLSNNTALTDLGCSNTNIPYVDLTNTSVAGFSAYECTYSIPSGLSFDVTSDFNFSGFDPNRVSNVQGADFSKESGIFDNFTSDTITYDYDCGREFTETFTLVMTGDIMSYALEDDEDSIETDFPEQDNDGEETAQPDETEAAEDEETVSTDTEEPTDSSDDTTADEPEQTEASGLSELLAAAAISAAAVSVNLMDIAIFSVNMIICLISILIKLWR